MSKVEYLVTRDTIHLSFDGKYETLTSSDKRFVEVRQLIKDGRHDEIPEALNRKPVALEEYIEGSGLFLDGGTLKDAEGQELPLVLSTRLQELKEEGFPVDSLVNFWQNLKQNPSMNSREQLFKFLEHNGHPLTEDGHFIAYRGIRSNFTDKHTGTMDNSPGKVVEMPREQVDDNPNQTCSKGLHVAAYGYASGFGDITVEVKVNPRDVVAVPVDYNGEKMRVCRFEVVKQCEKMQKAVVYGYSPDDYLDTWDGWGDDDELDEDDHDDIFWFANDYKDRYTDRASLAARIDEELDLGVAEILKVLNDNESEWV